MNKLLSVAFASILALGSLAARAADNPEERSELRQRAEAFQSERARNPEFQPGEGRLSPQQRSEPAATRQKAHAKRASKTQVKSGHTETRREKAAKKVRALKKIPGAFVRK